MHDSDVIRTQKLYEFVINDLGRDYYRKLSRIPTSIVVVNSQWLIECKLS